MLWKRSLPEVRTSLDFGSHSAKLLQVAFKDGKAVEIVKGCLYELPVPVSLLPSLADANPVVHWRGEQLNIKRVTLDFDPGGLEDQALLYEAERFLPYSSHEAQLTWLPLGGRDYFLALAPIEELLAFRQRFKGSLRLELTPDFALWRLAPGRLLIDGGHLIHRVTRPGQSMWLRNDWDIDAALNCFEDKAEPAWVGGRIPDQAARLDVASSLGLPAGTLGSQYAVAAGLLLPSVGKERLRLA